MIRTYLAAMLTAALIFACVAVNAPARAGEVGAQKAVLVTGASTGIGRRITEVLAGEGYYVYAGARKSEDIDALNAIENVEALRLDVTIQSEIEAAVATVAGGDKELHGLINNAGIFIGGPLADVDVGELQYLMDVNVFGVYRVTQAFAPLIIKSQGRIITTGSIAGTLAGPYSGQYSMSKHAIEAYTDSLAAEMGPLGVHVSVIEPGNYNSRIADTAVVRMEANIDKYVKDGSPFAGQMRAWIDQDWDRSKYKDPDEVAAAALHAISADQPLRRYMVVPNAEEAGMTVGRTLQRAVELNTWQAYSFSRDELVGILDSVLAPAAAEESE